MNNEFLTTIKTFKGKSVFFKYLASSLLIICAILIPYNIILYAYFNVFLDSEISSQTSINTYKSKMIFDLLTTSVHTNYNIAIDTQHITSFLTTTNATQLNTLRPQGQAFIKSLVSSSDILEDIYIYSFKNSSFISANGSFTPNSSNNLQWLKTYKSTKIPFVMFPRKINSTSFNYLYICSEIYDESQNSIGIFCSKIKYKAFVDIIGSSFEEEPEKIFIVSDLGLILYSNDEEMINTIMFEKDDIYKAFNTAKETEGKSFLHGDYVISVAKSTSSKLILMAYTNRNSYAQGFAFATNMIVFGGVFILLLSLIIALFISYRQYKSVVRVMHILQKPEEMQRNSGVLSEFFYISNSIHSMSKKNEQITNELTNKIISLKLSQIQALQTQINPHFLFNTLQLINLSIIKELKKDTVATGLISSLSSLLRICCDTDNYQISVKEELNNVRLYLNIQQSRYKDRLTILFNIEENVLNCQTLKLTLQPFVENCIVHGFNGKENNWQIKIYCQKVENFVEYRITDNGSGISPSRLAQIQADLLAPPIAGGKSIGIANVNQRLKLLYGKDYSISFLSGNSIGGLTSVIIRHIIS